MAAVRTTHRRVRLGGRLGCVLALLVGSILATLLAAAPAQAASAISSCFSYRGTRYQGLATFLEYYGTDGAWHGLDGSEGEVDPSGCANYTITGAYRTWNFRIHAVGAVPAWRGFFNGISAHYGPSGTGSWNLGETGLTFLTIPATWSTPPSTEVRFDSWLDGMTRSGSSSVCRSSSAAAVACYMDANGLVGNVVVPWRDSDGDGVFDNDDRAPNNKYYT